MWWAAPGREEDTVAATVLPAPERVRRAATLSWRLLRLLLTAVLVLLAVALAAATVPRAFGFGTLLVRSGSMGESHPTGSLVVARWVAASDVHVGDAILIRREGEGGSATPVLHRVHARREEGGRIVVETKGDANDVVDAVPFVLPERVLTPAYTIPYLGYLIALVATRLGWALFVILPAAVLAGNFLLRMWADDGPRRPAPRTQAAR